MIPKKILLCTDFSENSGPPLALSKEYAETFRASLAIVHVVDAWAGFPAYESRVPLHVENVACIIQESAKAELEAMAESCRQTVGEVTTHCRIGVPSQEIVRLADELTADLIVMGTHGWTGIKHLLLGSVTENVLRTAGRPVLVVSTRKRPLGTLEDDEGTPCPGAAA